MSSSQNRGKIPAYDPLLEFDGTEQMELSKDGKTWRGTTQQLIDKLPPGPKGEDGADGAAGADGERGADGKDAYQVWLTIPGNEGKTIEEWKEDIRGPQGVQGEQGIQGEKGDTGEDGADGDKGEDGADGAPGLPVQIEGPFNDESELPAAAGVPRNKLFVVDSHWYRAEGGSWVDLGEVKGPPGIGLVIKGSLPSLEDLPAQGEAPGETWIIEGRMLVWDSEKWSSVGVEGPQGIQGIKGDRGIQGEQGLQGEKGDPGEDASYVGEYDTVADRPETGNPGDLIWIKDGGEGFGVTHAWDKVGNKWIDKGPGRQGPQGEKGADGIDGEKGDPGAPSRLRGSVETNTELPEIGNDGDSWFVKNFNDSGVGHTVAWGVDDQQWIDLGAGVAGPKGDKGDRGEKGEDGEKGIDGTNGADGEKGEKGDSAFEVWKALPGNEDKTPTDFADFIEGKEGPQGIQGEKGADGEKGSTGLKGDPGDPLQAGGKVEEISELPDPEGYPVNVFYNLNGRLYMIVNDAWMDVGPVGAKGDKGDTGEQGIQGEKGADGANGTDGAKGDKGEDGLGITPKGTVANEAALPTEDVQANDTWVAEDTGIGYAWSELTSSWINIGQFRGPQGEKGEQGIQGLTGDKGEQGEKGDDGGEGPQGKQGDPAPIFMYRGEVELPADLDAISGAAGDAWVVKSENRVYLYNPVSEVFEQGPVISEIVGPEGPRGPQGLKGDRGPQGSEILFGSTDPTALTGKVTDLYLNDVSKELFRKQTDLLWVSMGNLSGSDVNEVAAEGIHARKTGEWVKLPDLPDPATMFPGESWGVEKDAEGVLVYKRAGSPVTEITPLTGTTLDRSVGSYFTFTPTGDATLTLAPFRDNTFAVLVLRVNGSAGAIEFVDAEWGDAGAPVQGTDFTTYVFYWDGIVKKWTGNRGAGGTLS